MSLQRSKAVYDYLIANKVNPDRLTFKGFGATKPISSNDTVSGRQQNRRTSFIITGI
ncbi:OmpA family protein [Pedobacter sp. NJ-S-72]